MSINVLNPEDLYSFGQPLSKYAELLRRPEWQEKRKFILERDGFRCTNCGCSETVTSIDKTKNKVQHFFISRDTGRVTGLSEKRYHLEVHHHIYIVNRHPWEYNNDDLTTFCNWCHHEFHQKDQVPVYSEDMLHLLNYTPCFRCHGAGWFPEYHAIYDGICFRCDGVRYEELIKR